jgi:PAS domain S-box-containing protein
VSTAGIMRNHKSLAGSLKNEAPLSNRHSHSVHFYQDDFALLDELTQYVGAALDAGDAAVVIATEAHRAGLTERLTDRGVDLSLAIEEGRYQALDAADTLRQFMVNERLETSRFVELVGGLITQLASAARGPDRQVAAFGEMVALLWKDGNREAAIHLEQLWNQLADTHAFQLHCAYPIELFSGDPDGQSIRLICGEHSDILPSAQYRNLATYEERLKSVLFLQQKAKALETEIRERKKVEKTLEEREGELKDFLDNAVIGMHWVAADGTILWANKAELTLLGYEPEEYIGHHIAEFHADRTVIDDILERLGRQEALHDYEARMRRKDGSIRYVRTDSNIFLRDGRFAHTRCFTIDITEKRRAEQAAFRLAAIVESSDDAIVSKDLNGIITSWNKGAERIFGYKAEEIIGQPVTTIIPPELHDDEPHILSKIRAGERIEHFQTVRLRKTGERIDVSLTVSPVKDQHGNIIGAAKIARDVTQQKRLEAALHVSERLASVGRLAATVAHEINNPLEAVTNFIYLAKQQPDLPEKIQRYLDYADQELARVAHIAQQTLGFYRDNSQPVPVVISDVVEDVLKVYDRRFKYKAIIIEKHIEPGLTLSTLHGELKQILSNLVANAIDASNEGGRILIRARASRHFRSESPGIRITVADDGVGISDRHKPSVFLPFFTTKQEVGTGLGLWVTRELLEKKGGHIRFRSRDSQRSGTVMTIYLPLKAPAKTSALAA